MTPDAAADATALDALPVGVALCDTDAGVVWINAALADWLDVPRDDPVGRPVHDLLAPAGRIYFETHVRPILLAEGACEEISLELRGPPGARRPVFLSARRADGRIHVVLTAAAQRAAYERELLAERRKAQAFEAIVRASPDAVLALDLDLVVQSWNPAAERLLGFSAADAVGRDAVALLVPEDRRDEMRAMHARLSAGGEVRYESERRHRDGARIPVDVSLAQIRDDRGHHAGTATVLRDITDRRAAEATIDTLNRELAHRSKNLLALVQGLASMTLRHSGADGFKAAFNRRLVALSNNLTVLVDRNWTRVGLDRLVRQQLAHLREELGERVAVEGPPVEIGARAAEGIGMALFELATNAVKYGALSAPEGRLDVAWTVAAGRLTLRWDETGIAGVAPPARSGFGYMLTGRLVEQSTGGAVAADWRPDGLRWRLDAELSGMR